MVRYNINRLRNVNDDIVPITDDTFKIGHNTSDDGENLRFKKVNSEDGIIDDLVVSTIGIGLSLDSGQSAFLQELTTTTGLFLLPVNAEVIEENAIWVEGNDLKVRIGGATYTITKV